MIEKAKPHFYISLTCYFALAATILFWTIWQGSLATFPFVLIFWILPLIFPAKGLLEGKPYTFAWTSFLALYYFMLGVFDAAGDETQIYGLAVVLFSVGLFCFSLAFARTQGKADKAPSSETTSSSEAPQELETSDEQNGQTLPWTPMIIGAFLPCSSKCLDKCKMVWRCLRHNAVTALCILLCCNFCRILFKLFD